MNLLNSLAITSVDEDVKSQASQAVQVVLSLGIAILEKHTGIRQ